MHIIKEGETIRETIPTKPGNYYDFFDGVYQSIKKGKTEPVTADDGLKVMKIIEAALESSKEGKVVKLV